MLCFCLRIDSGLKSEKRSFAAAGFYAALCSGILSLVFSTPVMLPVRASNQSDQAEMPGKTHKCLFEEQKQIRGPEKPACPHDFCLSGQAGHCLTPAIYKKTTSNYVGNIESLKFHECNCFFALIMAPFRQVDFQNKNEAIAAGMKPCSWCLPQWSTRVEGHIVGPANLKFDTKAPLCAGSSL